MYPKLLGFYSVAYGKDPAHTADGPTERFLTAYLQTLKKVAETVKIDGPEEVVANIEIPSRTFAVPTQAALRGRIREFYKEPATALVREMLRRFEVAAPETRRLN